MLMWGGGFEAYFRFFVIASQAMNVFLFKLEIRLVASGVRLETPGPRGDTAHLTTGDQIEDERRPFAIKRQNINTNTRTQHQHKWRTGGRGALPGLRAQGTGTAAGGGSGGWSCGRLISPNYVCSGGVKFS